MEVSAMGKERTQTAWQDLFSQAVEWHRKGVDGDKEAVKKAYDLLEKVRNLTSNNRLVEAYYGSTLALQGRDLVDPLEKLKKAINGLKMLDNVVSKEPENIEIRILRAFTCSRVPEEFLHRSSIAIEDLNYLLSRYESDRLIFSEQLYWDLLYELGAVYKNVGKHQESRETWKKLYTKTTDTKYRNLLKQEGIHTA
jgi:tetratricopeptide (TPR) repeat protein